MMLAKGVIVIRNTRKRKFNSNNRKLIIYTKGISIFYIMVIIFSYLNSYTGAYMSDTESIDVNISSTTWENLNQESPNSMPEDSSLTPEKSTTDQQENNNQNNSPVKTVNINDDESAQGSEVTVKEGNLEVTETVIDQPDAEAVQVENPEGEGSTGGPTP
jgi:YqxM protein